MIKFFKMHGIGNDYIFIDNIENIYSCDFGKLAKRLCDRHYSIGADGIIVLESCKKHDVKMKIYNSDGSKAKNCGNATRCVAFYIFNKRREKNLNILSENKVLKTKIENVKKNKAYVEANMGKCKYLGQIKTDAGGKNVACNIASIGNKHCIVFVDKFNFNINKVALAINNMEMFKSGINVEFVKMQKNNHLCVKVFERGSGRTLACGSGACVSGYVSYCLGKINKKNLPITVELEGGNLNINIDNKNNLIMSGECEFVYKGEINWL